MRRGALVLAVLAVLACPPLSAANLQKVLPLDDPAYRLTEELFISQALALPSTSRPWSCDELQALLSLLDPSRMTAAERAVLSRLEKEALASRPVFKAGARLDIEGYLHSNTAFSQPEDWAVGYVRRKPLIGLDLEFSPLENFYGFIGLGVRNSKFSRALDSQSGESAWFGAHMADANFRFLYSPSDTGLESGTPCRAFASVGGRGWSVSIGRDRLSWGPGRTGNLVLGGHLQYHNAVRAAVYTKAFKYTFLVSSFPHPDEVFKFAKPTQANPMGGPKLFAAHRFEGRAFGGRLGFAVTEGIMYQPANGVPSLRTLNPMMLFHNLYSPKDMNSIAALEVDLSFPRWNIQAQGVLDEFTAPNESSDAPWVHPNALGLIAGARCAYPGFSMGLEVALTDPSLYLRSKDGATAQTSPEKNMNYIVHIRRWSTNGGSGESLIYDPEFLGYRYGCDALVADLGLEFRLGEGAGLDCGVFYMAHGTHGKRTFWEIGPEAYRNRFPSGGWERACHTLDLRFGGWWEALPWLSLSFQLDCLAIANKGNVAGANAADVQLVVGAGVGVL